MGEDTTPLAVSSDLPDVTWTDCSPSPSQQGISLRIGTRGAELRLRTLRGAASSVMSHFQGMFIDRPQGAGSLALARSEC